MNAALWIVAAVLAAAFLAAGTMKIVRSKSQLAASGQGWVEDFPPALVKTIGALEVLAAIGLIGAGIAGFATVLVPLAAAGLVLLMLGAIATHGRRREWPNVAINVVLLVLALFVAIGRFGPNPL